MHSNAPDPGCGNRARGPATGRGFRVTRTRALIASLFVLLAVLLPLAGVSLRAEEPAQASGGPTDRLPASFSGIVEKVAPAVVNISTTQKLQASEQMSERTMPGQGFPPNSPFEEFFKRFFEQTLPPGAQRSNPVVHALGSGFIIDPSGYVVTNHHVIASADDIKVILNDGTQLTAKVVGDDAKTDLALLKVDAGKPLPYVSFGNSDHAKIGDWVIAVGNPFGLGGTVTAGIISARGRTLGTGPYDNFLQIDAPINRGNSGGPTFNIAGQVIGINSAIYSPNGGSVGIGFAIPANLAKPVLRQLRETGSVERGWLGVQIQPMTPDLADGFGLKEAKGALVVSVDPDGPAGKAGIRKGDVILGFDGKPIDKLRDLPRIVANTKAGSTASVTLWRDREEKRVDVMVGRMPKNVETAFAKQGAQQEPKSLANKTLGVSVSALTPDLRRQLNVPDQVHGVVVTGVRRDSAADDADLRPGDVIEEVDRTPIAAPRDVSKSVKKAEIEDRKSIVLLVNRNGSERYVAVRIRQA